VTGHRRLVRTLSGACLAAATVLAVSAPAGALAPDETGWWFKGNQDPTGALPVQLEPPHVPDGGLYVANDPSGPAGVSALRFFLAEDEEPAALLTLAPSSSATVADVAAIVACPSLTQWVSAPDGGPWAVRPEADCTTAMVPATASEDGATESEDGATVSWELPGATFARGGVYDVVLVPDPESSAPFQVPFEAPDDTSVQPVADPANTPTTEAAAFELEDLGVSEESFTAPESSSFAPPAFDTPTTPGPDVPAADTGEDEFTLPTAPPRPNLRPTGFSAERGVAIGVLAAVGVGLWVLAGRPIRAPRLLGGLAAESAGATSAGARSPSARLARPKVGGIGRFARPRTQPPTRV
jgi:hypothetical protein